MVSRDKRVTILDLQKMQQQGTKIPMLTAYDYPSARLAERAGCPILLVGDTLGMVVLGYDSTLPVTLEDMIHHGRAARRGASNAHIVVDLPFGSYQSDVTTAMNAAMRVMKETECDSVKIEGGNSQAIETVAKLVTAGVPVMAHIGLTPQSVNALGGFKLQGRTPRDAIRLLSEAQKLQEAGAFAIVLESVPAVLAAKITEVLSIPTIGIGAGPYCDGQVQVWHDLLGLYDSFKPRHARRFDEIGASITGALVDYIEAVRAGEFPNSSESFGLSEEVENWITRNLPGKEQSMRQAEQVLSETNDSRK